MRDICAELEITLSSYGSASVCMRSDFSCDDTPDDPCPYYTPVRRVEG